MPSLELLATLLLMQSRMIGFLGCEQTLPVHIQVSSTNTPKYLLHRATLNPLIAQPVSMFGIALTQV